MIHYNVNVKKFKAKEMNALALKYVQFQAPPPLLGYLLLPGPPLDLD